MNPKDAAAEGLLVGDKIDAYNKHGKVRLDLALDEAVPPGTFPLLSTFAHRVEKTPTTAAALASFTHKFGFLQKPDSVLQNHEDVCVFVNAFWLTAQKGDVLELVHTRTGSHDDLF